MGKKIINRLTDKAVTSVTISVGYGFVRVKTWNYIFSHLHFILQFFPFSRNVKENKLAGWLLESHLHGLLLSPGEESLWSPQVRSYRGEDHKEPNWNLGSFNPGQQQQFIVKSSTFPAVQEFKNLVR